METKLCVAFLTQSTFWIDLNKPEIGVTVDVMGDACRKDVKNLEIYIILKGSEVRT